MTLFQPDPNNSTENRMRINLILSLMYGLMGEVSPRLRAAAVEEKDDVIILYFYFDGEISEEDSESSQCVGTEVIADFPEHKINVRVERLDYPGLIPSIGELVYKRREP